MKIKRKFLLSSFIAFYSLCVGHIVHADDTELYVWSMSENEDARPKILILLDTSGSMGTKLTARIPFTKTTYNKIYWSTDGTVPLATSNNYFLKAANNCSASIGSLTAVGKYTDVLLQWAGDVSSGLAWKTLGSGSSSSVVDCYADVRSADITTASNPATNVAGVPADASYGPYSIDTTQKSTVFAYSPSLTLFTDEYVAWYAANKTGSYSRISVAKQAIKDIIYSNPNVDFGLEVYNNNNGSEQGGRVIKAVQTLTDSTRATFLNNVTENGSTPLTESYYEASLYWAGKSAKWGKAASLTPKFDSEAFTSGTDTYVSPFKTDGCNDTSYSIVITDGEPNGDTAANTSISSYITSYTSGMNATDKTKYSTAFSLPTSNYDKNSYLPHIAYYLYHTDLRSNLAGTQNVSTYTIGFGNDAVANAGALMAQTAEWGGGEYYPATDADALSTSLRKLMNDILDRQYSGVTPSTSVNIQDRSENLDRLYYPMFSPKKGPFWPGNIKKLKLVNSSYIADSTGKLAIGTDGRMLSTAQTYWSTVVDGSNVLLGGVQSSLSKQTSRKVLTNKGTTLLDINKTNLESISSYSDTQMAAYLGLSSSTGLDDQISWILGKDIDSQNTTTGLIYRENVLSDMMHSQPVAINYGGASTPDIRLVVGSNAGFLHMFKDNDSANTVSESWAFIPYELLPKQRTLRVNADGGAHVYGLDATPVVYTTDTNGDGIISSSDGDKVWLFMGQRQGGSNYYAFDITNPDSPVMMWQISGGSAGFERLAQTWSTPQITKIPGYSKPVLIFGGGYNTGKDSLALGTNDSVGNAIYIVDAETGVLKFTVSPSGDLTNTDMHDSIAAPVKTVDYDSDGYTDIIYAADTGGNVWRVDLPDSTQSHWSISKFASVGSDLLRADDRRFFGQPLVVTYSNTEVTKDGSVYTFKKKPVRAVLLGSGDRNHPRTDTVVGNMYYMFRDYQLAPYAVSATKPATITTSDLYDITSNPYGTAADDDARKQILADITAKRGWKYRMTGAGEKVFGSGVVSDGILYFSSFLPYATSGANVCSVGNSIGTTRIYAIDLDLGFYPDGNKTAFTSYNDTILENLGVVVGADKSVRLLTPVPDGSALDSNNVVKVDPITGKPVKCTGDAKCEIKKVGDNLPKIFKVYQAEQR